MDDSSADPPATETSVDLRCSTQSVEIGDSTLGTAGHDDHYLLIELPLPWPKSIEQHPLLAGLADPAASGSAAGTTRIMAILSDQPATVAPDGTPVHRLIAYRGGDGTRFSHFDRHEGFVRREHLVAVVDHLRSGDLTDLEPQDDRITDVLICTHGTRDRCCGQDGARLFLELAAVELGPARIWRTSHTGGHRFAPIALTFPDGYTWGRITSTDIIGILDRALEPGALGDRNRGCMGFAQPEGQVADAVALAEVGWGWLNSERSAVVRNRTPEAGSQVTVDVRGELAAFDVIVGRGARVPIPACGQPIEAATKSITPLFVVAVEAVR